MNCINAYTNVKMLQVVIIFECGLIHMLKWHGGKAFGLLRAWIGLYPYDSN